MFSKSPIMSYLKNVFLIVIWVIFSFHSFSQQTIFNSGWQFTLDSSKSNWQTVNIPHTWNKDDAFDDKKGYHRGIGWYQKNVFISSQQKDLIHYLKFNGVNQDAEVYINGTLLGSHQGGYTAFNFNVTPFLNYDSYNLIELKVDNSHNENIPPLDADFTFYGGIYRDVEWITVPKQHISLADFASDGFYIDYYHVSNEKAGVEVTVLVDNFDSVTTSNEITVILSDAENKVLLTEKQKVNVDKNGSKTLKMKLPEINTPRLWSPEDPYLYRLNITLSNKSNEILDEKSHSIGFRWVSVDAQKGLYLNGNPYKMIGVNRHQDFEGYGNAVPMYLQERDIHLIKDMGANVIRFAHYPHSRELYQLCDELGLLVWSEIPIVNKVTNTSEFFETSMKMHEAHLKQYYNFPSVVMFGYMNEIFLRMAFDNKSTEKEKDEAKVYTYQLAEQLETLTRKIAPTRITVMALHFNELYNETKIADLSMLIGWNLYFGWYHDGINDLGVFLDEQHKRFPNRAIMVSEYGPGADVRISAETPRKYDFSQEYQLLLHKGYYKQVMERDFVAGMTAWNFADFGSEFRGDAIAHVNQKGLVQYNREPKDVYYWYKSVLNDEDPFVHIAINSDHSLNLIDKKKHSLSVFSNQSEGKVYLNNEMLETINFKGGMATVAVPFSVGKNILKVVTSSSEDTKTINVHKIDNLKLHQPERFGINIGSHFDYTDQANDIVFMADRPYTQNLFGHIDGKVFNLNKEKHQGIPHDIMNTTSEPLFQTMLEGCTSYKVDVQDGSYKVTLYFVEPQLKSEVDVIYNLNDSKNTVKDSSKQRIFDVLVNNKLVESQFNMSKSYPEKYGVSLITKVNVTNNEGLTINLVPIEGTTVFSGVLIEKIK